MLLLRRIGREAAAVVIVSIRIRAALEERRSGDDGGSL
jgi:hypothetical protein